jgi:hypothetical protein
MLAVTAMSRWLRGAQWADDRRVAAKKSLQSGIFQA